MEPCAEPSCPAFATRGAFCPVHAETPLAAARAKEIGHRVSAALLLRAVR